MSRVTHIYALMDPRTDEVRYVGKTVSVLSLRLSQHINQATREGSSTRRDNWIKSLRKDGLAPAIKLIEDAGDDWAHREIHWISYYRTRNSALTNHSDGGEGPAGAKRTVEQREALSKRLKEAAKDPGTRKKLIAQLKAAVILPGAAEKQREHLRRLANDPVRRSKHSEYMKRIAQDEAWRVAAGNRLKTHILTEEQRARRNASVRLAYQDPVIKERHLKATLAATSDPVFKAKQRAAITAAIRDPDVQRRRVETLKASPGYAEMVTKRNAAIRAARERKKAAKNEHVASLGAARPECSIDAASQESRDRSSGAF